MESLKKMGTDDEPQTAITTPNATQVARRSLTVNEARPKGARRGSFGRGQSPRHCEPGSQRWRGSREAPSDSRRRRASPEAFGPRNPRGSSRSGRPVTRVLGQGSGFIRLPIPALSFSQPGKLPKDAAGDLVIAEGQTLE